MSNAFALQGWDRRHIVLVGLSGTGKTTAGRLLAERLGRRFIDTDWLIEELNGTRVPDLLRGEGEAAFRNLESQALEQALAAEPAVIATGGGIVLRDSNRRLLRGRCWTIWLQASPERLARRLEADSIERPLLRDDPLARLEELLERREPLYREVADLSLDVASLSAEQVAEELERRWQAVSSVEPLWVTSSSGRYPVVVAPDALHALPAALDSLGLRGRCWLISDDVVGALYGGQVEVALSGRGLRSFYVAAGEQRKSLEQAAELYDWLLAGGVERGDVVLALGGGVIGDLAGFVASTILRGVALVHLPTNTQAMIDSSIGGKTGVNHQRGKNLIGTFYPPRLVLADTRVLRSVPRRELIAGLAEGIKHGVIADAQLFADLEAGAGRLLELEEPLTGELIRRMAAIKVATVSQDERESGVRTLLNYGHTLGHALEAAAGYGTLLHGEAVAIGMELAGRIAVRLGRFSQSDLERQRALLHSVGLPTALPGDLTVDALLAPIGLDKKREGGAVRWVLPERIGKAGTSRDVPLELVRAVVVGALEESRR